VKPVFLAGPDDGRLDFWEATDRDEITLEEDLIFIDSRGLIWIAPTGLVYDGASIPRLFWALTGHPLQARHVPAGGLHDQAYRTGLRLTIDPEALAGRDPLSLRPSDLCALPRIEVLTDRAEVDYFAFYEPLLATRGNTLLHARVVWRAVRIGGWAPWRGHEKRRALERMPFSMLSGA
jgi:hypothetical protein